MSNALMNKLKREEGGVSMHVERLQNLPSNHVYREMEKVKFPGFWALVMGKWLRPHWKTW
jgi:hypothetical protein